MRFKIVPAAPDDLAFVETVQRAVPLVPATEDDCCARLMDRTDVTPRDEARTWVTFLRALGLAEAGPSGFTRTRRDPDPEHLREAFRAHLHGAEEILEILAAAEEPLSSAEVYERFESEIPQYERHRYKERLPEIWGKRVDRLLEWAVLLDLAERTDGGYRRD